MVAFLSLVAALAVSISGHAHPEHAGKGHAHEHETAPGEITEKQKEKRLARVIRQAERRQRNRPQRAKDRRMHLRRRLGRHLQGADMTPEMVNDLKNHARRTAMIRQIRYVAAQENDHASVVRADQLFARENRTHEVWWRDAMKAARAKP